jgi:hypothetical protein
VTRGPQYAGLPVGASQGYSWDFQLQPDGETTIVTDSTGARPLGSSQASCLPRAVRSSSV